MQCDLSFAERKEICLKKFRTLDFQVGDIFTEMYSYYAIILSREGENITVYEGHPAGNPSIKMYQSLKEFEKEHSYGNIEGHWVTFLRNDPNHAQSILEHPEHYGIEKCVQTN